MKSSDHVTKCCVPRDYGFFSGGVQKFTQEERILHGNDVDQLENSWFGLDGSLNL